MASHGHSSNQPKDLLVLVLLPQPAHLKLWPTTRRQTGGRRRSENHQDGDDRKCSIPRNDKTYIKYVYIYTVHRYTSYRCMQYINVCNFCRFLQVLSTHYSASVQPDDLSLEATQPQEWCKTSTCDLSLVPASKLYDWNMAI